MSGTRKFVSLGMFIIDEFTFLDVTGKPTGRTLSPQEDLFFLPSLLFQIGGAGTYANIGARIWLPAGEIGMIVDKGVDLPQEFDAALRVYGEDMWFFRAQPDAGTTRALNAYKGDHRNFQYLTPRIRITPRDLAGTTLFRPITLHFICSPTRAAVIMSQVAEVEGWHPISIYEPIPDRCIPEELSALRDVLPLISVLSPNAEEALGLLSIPLPVTKSRVELACQTFLDSGVGPGGAGWVVIRSGSMGAYVASRSHPGIWIEAYWGTEERVIDVTGAGNSFLGGLAAGLTLTNGDVFEAAFHATVSASYTVEQFALPQITRTSGDVRNEEWNGDSPWGRLQELKARCASDR
ncbi:Ribokinase-like protein [Multifurca ochricompacta]|uniref:Ribokinase-like protein n=1 Tax=Multifurca ochricompacta TaxID=376703 RepID=A0AAD4M5I3_9AGAM|nr:Ribokinase-like protein [Multifurca ochricompacta]